MKVDVSHNKILRDLRVLRSIKSVNNVPSKFKIKTMKL